MRVVHSLSERIMCHIMGGLRILLANEPRSYRESIGAALQALRPEAVLCTAEPEMLDHELENFTPHLVVCSSLTLAVENNALAWVDLYPVHKSFSVVSIGGKRSVVDEIELPDVLSVVDRIEIWVKAG